MRRFFLVRLQSWFLFTFTEVLAEGFFTCEHADRLNERMRARGFRLAWVAVCLVLACVCLRPAGVWAGDAWSAEDTAYQVAWSLIHVVDWGTSRAIAADPHNYHEFNPLIGRHPSRDRVDLVMASGLVVSALVARRLPARCEVAGFAFNPRRSFQVLSISVSSGLVANNYAVGLTMKW